MRFLNFELPTEGTCTVQQAACMSHPGRKRPNNEDNLFFQGVILDSDNHGTGKVLTCGNGFGQQEKGAPRFFAVFDGMGGGDYGEIASSTAADEARRFFWQNDQVDRYEVSLSLDAFCQRASERVFDTARNLGSTSTGTTMVGCLFLDGRVWVANVGDSRCYRLRSGKLEQLSTDHTDEAEMKRHGITGRKPFLTQYLGCDPDEMFIEPAIVSHYLQRGDRFLLCSDGLTDMVPLPRIQTLLSGSGTPSQIVAALVNAALDGGGKDNITVMLCHCQ